MTPIETKALAEVMFWYAVLILVFAVGVGVICHIYDCIEETPEEQAQREQQRIVDRNAKELQRIFKRVDKENKRRQRMRSVRFWNF